jgi:hypothetical protein
VQLKVENCEESASLQCPLGLRQVPHLGGTCSRGLLPVAWEPSPEGHARGTARKGVTL